MPRNRTHPQVVRLLRGALANSHLLQQRWPCAVRVGTGLIAIDCVVSVSQDRSWLADWSTRRWPLDSERLSIGRSCSLLLAGPRLRAASRPEGSRAAVNSVACVETSGEIEARQRRIPCMRWRLGLQRPRRFSSLAVWRTGGGGLAARLRRIVCPRVWIRGPARLHWSDDSGRFLSVWQVFPSRGEVL